MPAAIQRLRQKPHKYIASGLAVLVFAGSCDPPGWHRPQELPSKAADRPSDLCEGVLIESGDSTDVVPVAAYPSSSSDRPQHERQNHAKVPSSPRYTLRGASTGHEEHATVSLTGILSSESKQSVDVNSNDERLLSNKRLYHVLCGTRRNLVMSGLGSWWWYEAKVVKRSPESSESDAKYILLSSIKPVTPSGLKEALTDTTRSTSPNTWDVLIA